MKRILTLALLLVAVKSPVPAQDRNSCAAFDKAVKSTYDFKPSMLTESQKTSKSDAMDRFWKMVKDDPDRLAPCLRTALQAAAADRWFCFDASSLLVEVDPSPSSKALQVRSYTAADLDDVDLRDWVSLLARRGFEGFDVSAAASRWMAYPNAHYFLPEHGAYEVKRSTGALFIFGSMDEGQATPALIRILGEPKHPGREDAVSLLMSQATPESLRALKQVDASSFTGKTRSRLQQLLTRPTLLEARAKPKTTREEFIRAFQEMLNGDSSGFMSLVASVPDGEKDVVAVMKPEDLPLVRKVRRRIIAGGNQHSIEYYETFTDILMALVWRAELVK